ncbi:MAG: GAF domain-containing protein [Leptospiraceae bacterium]|nr:GAF domain-containing protein [Leptospiraceae bacterium]
MVTLGACSGVEHPTSPPKAVAGVLDLRQWNFPEAGIVPLTGEWKFYPEKLAMDIQPSDQSGLLAPGPWNDFQVRNQAMGALTYGTYRLKVILPENIHSPALYINAVDSAMRVRVQDVTMQVGIPGRTPETTEHVVKPIIVNFEPEVDGTALITIEVANFAHRNGGMLVAPELGEYKEIVLQEKQNQIWQAMLAAVFLLFGFYLVALHLIRTNRTALWAGTYSLYIALRTTLTGNEVIHIVFPQMPFELDMALEYLGLYLSFAFFSMLAYELFPDEYPRRLRNLFCGAGFLMVCTLALPIFVYTSVLPVFQLVVLLFVPIAVYVPLRAVLRRRPSALIFLSGFILLGAGIVHDIVINFLYGNSPNYTSIGLIGFVFAQALVIGFRYAAALNTSEDLSNNLERKVENRTAELIQAQKSAETARQEAEVLASLALKANESNDLHEIARVIADVARDRFGSDCLGIYIFNDDSDQLELRLVSLRDEFLNPDSLPEIIRNISIPGNKNETISRTFKRQKVFYAKTVSRAWLERHPVDRAITEALNVNWLIQMPMVVDGETLGVLCYSGSQPAAGLQRSDLLFAERMGAQIAGTIRAIELLRATKIAQADSDRLLANVLPAQVADELKREGTVEPLFYDSVTVMFTDFVGFTEASAKMLPHELISELDGLFSQFDEVIERNSLEKLKTIGDSYMCAGGLPLLNQTHAIDACLAALEIRAFILQMAEVKAALGFSYWQIRIGIHTGSVTAGVIGKNKFAYDIWGDTVNTASRMESSGEPGKINISDETHTLVQDLFECQYRGKKAARGKGEIDMYFLARIKPEYAADEDGLAPNELFHEKKTEIANRFGL